ncbi:MAG: glycosyl hydrolase [Planctomycetota bacterium]
MNPTLLATAVMTMVAPLVAQSKPRVNLARYQLVVADSQSGGATAAANVTDGKVCNDRRWQSSGNGPHWCEVRFGSAVEIGSAHVFTGIDDTMALSSLSLQQWNGFVWIDIPGTVVTNNSAVQLQLTFAAPVTVDRIRLYSTDATAHVRELALYAPSATPVVWGTDYLLNLGRMARRVETSSNQSSERVGVHAVDGYADDNSMWVSGSGSGPHWFQFDLLSPHKIGSVHVHSGTNAGAHIVANASLQFWNGSVWQNALAFPISNNTQPGAVLQLVLPLVTDRLRVRFPDGGAQHIRELCVFPFHDANGYPLGTDAWPAPFPAQRFHDYHDDFYGLRQRAGNLSIRGGGTSAELWQPGRDKEAMWQLLLEKETDHYAIRNRATGQFLEVAGASRALLAPIVETEPGGYTGMPHQLWRIEQVGNSWYRFINVHSGYALDTSASSEGSTLRQVFLTSGTSQQWAIDFAANYPKKGLGGWDGQSWQIGNSWLYNWGEGTGTALPFACDFAPMFWGDWGWSSRHTNYSRWHREDRKTHLMAFNEPDNSSQSNMSVARSVDLWPLLEEARLPLVSPGMTHPGGSWAQSWISDMDARGYDYDYYSAHWYASPDAGGLMNSLQYWANLSGRPVWLTEFSNVDWSGSNSWSYADCYNFFGEILWRMELASFVRRYAIFIFRGDALGPTSHFYYPGSTDLTPVGELYTAWDGDTVVRSDVAYHVHNLGMAEHLGDTGGVGPDTLDIYQRGATTEWAFRPAGGGFEHVDNLATGRRLASDGGNVTMVSPTTAGPSVQWRRIGIGNGYYYLEHSSGNRLRHNPAGHLEMLPGWTLNSARWRFVKAYQPADATVYGTRCGNADLELVGVPVGGGTVTLRVDGAGSSAPAFVAVSLERGQAPLHTIGMSGCYANVAAGPLLLGTVGGAANPLGQFAAQLPIPKGFVGTVYAQGFVLQPLLNSLNLSATRGVAVHVR